ncbi:MAG: LPS ABC transporter substrate-binding protein LptA [Hyphomicrobiales bacterium]|nr:LPS ABC transporter substrate-binding protein LptA [Hyphomicrobiales bacterium]
MICVRALQLLAATALIAIAASSSGLAQRNQGQQNALQGFSQNRDQPVKIQAVSLEVREKDKMATFSGDVHVVNGDTELRCKSLRVFYDDEAASAPASTANMKAADPGPNGSKQIKRIEARGGVVVVQKEQQATGDTAIFNMRENTVVLSGNVVITREGNVLTGQKLMVDLTNGVSKMESSSGRSGGMVQGVFQTTRPAEKK